MLKKLCIVIMLLIPALVFAQNSEKPEVEAPPVLPPPPDPISAVSTEKKIDKGLTIGTEVIPEKPDREPAPDPRNLEAAREAKRAADAAQTQQEQSTAPSQPPSQQQTLPPPGELEIMEELSVYNVPTGNTRTMKFIIDEQYNLRYMIYGEELGYIHVLSADYEGNFREVWKSPSLNAPVRGVFLDDLENDGEAEIIAYTADGNFFIYGFESHDLKYRTQDRTYISINCMLIANMDSSPEKELLFIAVKPGEEDSQDGQPVGNLIQFDAISQFEEWTSQEKYSATDMIIGNVDNDPEPEIILNTGEILSSQFKDLEWQSNIAFGSRLYLIDLDDDGILELVTEYDESYVRIFDVDQRQEKW